MPTLLPTAHRGRRTSTLIRSAAVFAVEVNGSRRRCRRRRRCHLGHAPSRDDNQGPATQAWGQGMLQGANGAHPSPSCPPWAPHIPPALYSLCNGINGVIHWSQAQDQEAVNQQRRRSSNTHCTKLGFVFPDSPPPDAIVVRGRDQRPKMPGQSRATSAHPHLITKPTPGQPPGGHSLKSSESPTYSEKKGIGRPRMRPKLIRQCRTFASPALVKHSFSKESE